jgi:hypothetical protein
MILNILSKMKKPVTKVKPNKKASAGIYTVQVYDGGVMTIGIKTGIKPGPHYGGKGNLS